MHSFCKGEPGDGSPAHQEEKAEQELKNTTFADCMQNMKTETDKND